MTTANGIAFGPKRTVTFTAGAHAGYQVTGSGAISASKTATLPRQSTARVGQRSTLPGLPGYWLHVEDGIWAGMWIAEGPARRLAGGMPDRRLAASMTVKAGSYTIVRLGDGDAVVQRRAVSLPAGTRAPTGEPSSTAAPTCISQAERTAVTGCPRRQLPTALASPTAWTSVASGASSSAPARIPVPAARLAGRSRRPRRRPWLPTRERPRRRSPSSTGVRTTGSSTASGPTPGLRRTWSSASNGDGAPLESGG